MATQVQKKDKPVPGKKLTKAKIKEVEDKIKAQGHIIKFKRDTTLEMADELRGYCNAL